MAETIEIDVPRQGIGRDLTEALAAHGLHAEIVDADEQWSLQVCFATDERERLLVEAVQVIGTYLSDRELPLFVQRTDGGLVVRPPGD